MTDKLKEHVSMQRWVIVLLLPLLITFMGLTLNVVYMVGNTNNKVETNTTNIQYLDKDIKTLEEIKVDKDEYYINHQRIYDMLDRIENKVDDININNPKK